MENVPAAFCQQLAKAQLALAVCKSQVNNELSAQIAYFSLGYKL
jgi:hypothetical protein